MVAPQHRKPGLPRTPVPERSELSDDNAHLWAVSYADLLMVLLSFFIIFFSVEATERTSVIERILASEAMDGSKASEGIGTQQFRADQGLGTGEAGFTGLLGQLKEANSKFGISVVQQGTSIVLLFPNNIFAVNKTELLPEYMDQLQRIIHGVLPYRDQVDLTFIGSTDDSPVIVKSKFIKNNFDISALRASRAMMLAAHEGFPLSGLRMKASASYERKSRTLSIQIKAKEKQL